MQCYLCGKQIGLLRSIADQQYCSAAHRREARLASAGVLREEDEDQEIWSVSKKGAKQTVTRSASSSQTPAIALFALAALVVAMIMLPKSDGGGSARAQALSRPVPDQGLVARTSDSIGSFVRDRAPVTLHHDFQTGMSDWVNVALSNTTHVDDPHDWKTPTPSSSSLVVPGSLRLWSRSIPLRNYQMDFSGKIERKSLSWAFRASNPANYYAAKIEITRPGPQPNADLIHYAMIDGHMLDRVQLPLPLTLEKGNEYLVRVGVQDDRFVTFLNGQVISSWSDKRLTRGGVGFFSDSDDAQQVSWVSLSERDTIMGRMLAHFGLVLFPAPID